MRVLVTGGAGYIGSVLVEELMRDAHQVTVYDNLSKGHHQALTPGAEFVQADLLDRERLTTELRQRDIESVIHMAEDSLVGESVEYAHARETQSASWPNLDVKWTRSILVPHK